MRWHRNLASWDSGVSNSLPLSASHTFAHLSQLAVALRHESGFKWIELQYLLERDSCASFCTCENYQVRQFQETLQFLTIDILLGQVLMHTVHALWDYSGKAPGLSDHSHLVSNPAPRFALPAALLVILTSPQKLISFFGKTQLRPSLEATNEIQKGNAAAYSGPRYSTCYVKLGRRAKRDSQQPNTSLSAHRSRNVWWSSELL